MTLTKPAESNSQAESLAFNESTLVRPSLLRDFAINFLWTGVAFVIVHAVVSRAHLLGATPIFSDDYDGFGSTFAHLRTSWFRPLSTALWSVLCACGTKIFFGVAEIWTVVYIASVLTYTKRLFQIVQVPALLTITAATLAVSFEYLTQYYFFSGAILGIMSGSFAMASMLFYFGLNDSKEKFKFPLMSSVFAIASLLCKEDFILPLLLFYGYETFAKKGDTRNSALCVSTVIAAVLAITVLLQKVVMPSQFFSGQSAHYVMNFGIGSIASMYWQYLTCSVGARIALVVQAAITIWALISQPRERVKITLFSLQTLVLIGPFSLLANHFCEFYAFSWICFQSATVILLSKSFGAFALNSKLRGRTFVGLMIVMMVGTVCATQERRHNLLGWYQHTADVGKRIDETLLANKVAIANAPLVAVVDPPVCSPWMRADGTYLKNKLGLTSEWIVYAKKNSELGKMAVQFGDVKHDGIVWHQYEGILPATVLPLLKFNEDGTGALTASKETGK